MIHIDPTATGIGESAVLYRNVLAEGTLAWSSEQVPDGYAANALGPATFDFWLPAAIPSPAPAVLQVTLAEQTTCDTAAIIAHTLGTSGCTLEVQFNAAASGGTGWVTVQSVTPEDDADLVLLFGEATGIRWRLLITGPAIPAIGVAMIGPRLMIPDGVQAGYTPVNLALSVDLLPNITRGGQFLGNRVQRVGAGTSVALAPQERWWIEEEATGFIAHYNEGLPFIWMSCPDLLPEDGHYCWRSGATLSASFGAGAMWGEMAMEVAAYVGS